MSEIPGTGVLDKVRPHVMMLGAIAGIIGLYVVLRQYEATQAANAAAASSTGVGTIPVANPGDDSLITQLQQQIATLQAQNQGASFSLSFGLDNGTTSTTSLGGSESIGTGQQTSSSSGSSTSSTSKGAGSTLGSAVGGATGGTGGATSANQTGGSSTSTGNTTGQTGSGTTGTAAVKNALTKVGNAVTNAVSGMPVATPSTSGAVAQPDDLLGSLFGGSSSGSNNQSNNQNLSSYSTNTYQGSSSEQFNNLGTATLEGSGFTQSELDDLYSELNNILGSYSQRAAQQTSNANQTQTQTNTIIGGVSGMQNNGPVPNANAPVSNQSGIQPLIMPIPASHSGDTGHIFRAYAYNPATGLPEIATFEWANSQGTAAQFIQWGGTSGGLFS